MMFLLVLINILWLTKNSEFDNSLLVNGHFYCKHKIKYDFKIMHEGSPKSIRLGSPLAVIFRHPKCGISKKSLFNSATRSNIV